jgi:hypothetical protein
MFPCPHCGKAIELGPPAKMSWWQYDSGRAQASLGCGTLILIAIIVAIFSRGGDNDHAIGELRKDIQSLKKSIERIQVNSVAAQRADPKQDQQ